MQPEGSVKQKLSQLVQYSFRYVRRVMAKALFRFIAAVSPKKGKIITFDSMSGKQYSCNPRAIYEYMSSHYADPKLCFVWAFREPEKYSFYIRDPRTIVCRYNSFKYFYYCCRSDAVIFNFGWPFADNAHQIKLQTWHGGGCYKKIGLAMNYNTKIRNWFSRSKMRDITHFVSSSRYFTEEVIRKQYNFHGTVLSTGMPRNDILFVQNDDRDELAEIRRELKIPKDMGVILYAPTYGQLELEDVEVLDYERVKRAAEKRFGRPFVFLYRGHHYEEGEKSSSFDLDASEYPDMKDILRVTDILITNYSSSIWDFSFTGRPCFLFTPDLFEYEKYRGFDKDIREWGFPICMTNEQLEETIGAYDAEAFAEAMRRHHEDLGSYETGEATQKIAEFIAGAIGISPG